MSSLFNRFKKLIQAESNRPSLPSGGIIKRSEKFNLDYDNWLMENNANSFRENIKKEFALHLLNEQEESKYNYTFLENPSSKGVVIKEDIFEELIEYKFLMDYLKGIFLTENYKNYTSDIRFKEEANKVLEIHRHYLKLDPRDQLLQGGLIEQHYGNVSIELYIEHGFFKLFKIQANQHSGNNFIQAKNLEELIGLICS